MKVALLQVPRRQFLRAVAAAALTPLGCGIPDPAPYSVAKTRSSEGLEYRAYSYRRHFLSIIEKPGMLILRPHPGFDPNGWGTSWYVQPFLASTGPIGALAPRVTASDQGVTINATGQIVGAKGTWQLALSLSFSPNDNKVLGTGTMNITLGSALSEDLNIFRIASNYLTNVPLLGGGVGNTGDMTKAEVKSDQGTLVWAPTDGNTSPTDETKSMTINVVGDYNDVDTQAQGYKPIAPAYKPTVKVSCASRTSAMMRFSASYDTSFDKDYQLPKSQLFFEDNVGLHALIYRTNPDRSFSFDLALESTPLLGG